MQRKFHIVYSKEFYGSHDISEDSTMFFVQDCGKLSTHQNFKMTFDLLNMPIVDKFAEAWKIESPITNNQHRIFYNEYATIDSKRYIQLRDKLNDIIDEIAQNDQAKSILPIDISLKLESIEDLQLEKLNALHRYFEDVSYELIKINDYGPLYNLLESVNQLVHSLEKRPSENPSSMTVIRNDKENNLEIFQELDDDDYMHFEYETQSNILFLDFGTVGKDLATCAATNDIELVKQKEIKQQTHVRPFVNYKFLSQEQSKRDIWLDYGHLKEMTIKWVEENDLMGYVNPRFPPYNPGRAILGKLSTPLSFNQYIKIKENYPYIVGVALEENGKLY